MSPCLAYLSILVFVLFTTSGLSEFLYNGARLAGFSNPDFRTSFLFRSNNGSDSFREVYTGQNQMPFHVRVYAKVLSGSNDGFCFEGVGSAQVSARKTGHHYGGLIYAYNSNYVRIWAPSSFKSNSNARIIFVREGWGGERYSQLAEEALVVVEVWNIGPVPTFQTNIVVDVRHSNRVFFEIDHQLAEIPERVLVRVTPVNDELRKASPNYGFWFNGISSSQNVEKKGYGGVIFAYNEKKIQLWLPNNGTKNTGCVYVRSGWGGEQRVESAPRCTVYIFAWVMKFPVPSFITDWQTLSSQGDSFLEIVHSMNIVPSLVIVQGRIDNNGLIFEGTGAVMSTDSNLKGYGGILFAYDKNTIRIWLPERHNGTKNGYSIFVNDGWGNGRALQQSHTVKVRVLLYTSNCNVQETVTEKGICQNLFNSYHWTMGQWFRCSSICNKGERKREVTGCEVSTTKTVLSCGFDKDFCSWKSHLSSAWHRVNEQRRLVDGLNLSWNEPNNSHYIFALANSSEQPVDLASPKFSAHKSCSLSFNYKMFGVPPPILSVHVSLDDRVRVPSGWIMQDDQGGGFWRQGYVKLTKFTKLTQVFFRFALRPKPENDRSPSSGNISLDEIKLECEAAEKTTVEVGVCQKHKVRSAGCIQLASEPSDKGPAFGQTNAIKNQKYVIAIGQLGDAIASYEFMVHVAGEFSIWLHAFGTSTADNGVRFQIDNLDHFAWHTTYVDKITRPLWVQYMYETFYLRPGVHTIYLSQLEANFRFSHIVMTPKRLLTWAPLGLQSRYIPDSHMRAYPQSSVPEPKFGRLNGVDAWCSSDHNRGFVLLEIALPELALVSRIAVQGGEKIKKKTNSYWVTQFWLKVSVDGINFSWYRVSSGKKLFAGNTDPSGIVEHELPFAVLAKKLRFYPYSWKNWICMRVELYGLYMTSSMCGVSDKAATHESCDASRNCSSNANCRPLTKDSVIKTGLADDVPGREACHCHTGYHGGSCQHYGCQPNPCENGGTCQARASNFTCLCQSGYHGTLCQHTCPVGKYGKDCIHQCFCGTHGSCNTATGHCSCEPGYYGGSCDRLCPAGYYGDDCGQRCACENQGKCDHVSGSCECLVGWMGKFCSKPCMMNYWGTQCGQRCHCSKNALSCDRITGKCICKAGKTGKACDQSCPVGTYGSLCTGTCQCSNYGTCDNADGNCTCHVPGWTGVKCHQPCPRGFYGVGCSKQCACPGNAECNATSGDCKCGSGSTGSRCHLPCSGNTWGPGCENSCHCANNATCDGVTGACRCPAGWHGMLCSNNCTDGKWGSTCSNTCDCQNDASCHSLTGDCQCQSGWSGTKCEKPCQTGFYGPRCESKCLSVHGNSCKPTTGAYHCPAGWLGRTCAEACPSGYYGEGCSKLCSCANGATCDHVSGSCTCTAGWTGSFCSQLCPNGFYGNGCARQCHCSPENYVYCHHVTGRCQCKDGYVGVRCSASCDQGYFGKLCKQRCRCENGAECRSTDGECVCLAGYHGDSCESRCPAMHYGINCSQTCSACIHSQVSGCNTVTGKCICLPGYYGYHCENPCPEGKHGLACASNCECQHGAHCNHVNGSCECAAGYTGDKCDERCPEGYFGNKCLGVCLCENGGLCGTVSGECRCLAGYQGTQCIEMCAKHKWGVKCRNKCNCAWNHTMRCTGDTGTCECRAGYSGTTCDKLCDDGFYGQGCEHRCPKCSRHVTGTCYQVDGRCRCSPGYRGHLCDNDCPLKNVGENCGQRCRCEATDSVCHHVDGKCFPISSGRFQIMIEEKYTDVDDIQRRKQMKIHVALLMSSHYDEYMETLHRLSRRETPSQSPPSSQNTTVTTHASSAHVTPSTDDTSSSSRHDFVARILDLSPGLSSDGKYEIVIVAMMMFDGADMLNGSIVKDVIESIDEEELTEVIGSVYYSGSLYSESSAGPSVYIRWITSVAGGLLLLVIIVIMSVICRRRRQHLKTLKKQRKKEKEAETEMELRTRSFRHNGYRLAFDNPYYDVLAAMAMDDDIEEDYINPLCDLESLMSHQGSDATVSSATECSIPKGESLQSVSYC